METITDIGRYMKLIDGAEGSTEDRPTLLKSACAQSQDHTLS